MAKTRKISASQSKPGPAGKSTASSKAKPAGAKAKKTGAKAEKTGAEVTDTGENGDNGNGKPRCKSLVIDGIKYRTRLNYKFENRKPYEHPDSRKITSSIPGTIVKLMVKEGQEVKQGEQMLILEAMKMKNIILFNEDGTVKRIHVREGEKVSKNHLMLELK